MSTKCGKFMLESPAEASKKSAIDISREHFLDWFKNVSLKKILNSHEIFCEKVEKFAQMIDVENFNCY